MGLPVSACNTSVRDKEEVSVSADLGSLGHTEPCLSFNAQRTP